MKIIAAVAGVLLLGAAQALIAAGFYLSEVGTPGSLGSAGVGNPTNTRGADSVWTNPAGMTGIDRRTVAGGMTLALPKIEFSPDIAAKGGSDGGNAGVIAPIPGSFYVHPVGDKWRLGFSITAPLGGGVDYGDSFVGRYSVSKVAILGAGLSSALAYRVNDRFSIGGGVSLVYTSLEEDIALNQGLLPDGKISIDNADDFGIQGYFGLTWQMTDRVLLGAVYRTEFDTELKGDVKVSNLLTRFNPSGTVKLDWTNPQWLDLGLRFRAREDLDLMVSGGWQEWSEYSSNQLAITTSGGRAGAAVIDRQWDDTWYLGIAAEKRFGDSASLTLGVKYDSSPVDDANRTFDLPVDETWTVSASYGWTGKGRFDYAIGGSLLYSGDADIDQTSQGVRVTGDFDSNWIFFLGGTLRHRF
jgi:long-chain fatty acid transport protein